MQMAEFSLLLLNYTVSCYYRTPDLSNFEVVGGLRGGAQPGGCLDREGGGHLQRHFVGGSPFCCWEASLF